MRVLLLFLLWMPSDELDRIMWPPLTPLDQLRPADPADFYRSPPRPRRPKTERPA